MGFNPFVSYCRPVENGVWETALENEFGTYTPCATDSLVTGISHLVLLGTCLYRIWVTKKNLKVQRFKLRSNIYNYWLGLLALYSTAEPLFRLIMGVSAFNVDGEPGLAPYEIVTLVIKAVAWGSMFVVIGLETMVYVCEVRWFVRFGVLYALLGDAVLINLVLSVSSYYSRYNETRDEIENMLNQKAFRNMDLLLPPPVQADIIPITTYLASLKTQKAAWIKGKIMVESQDRPYTHTGCANCLKPLEADLTWIVQCPTCKTECEIQLIVRATVQIDDKTATIKIIPTSPIIEKFIATTSSQIRSAEEAASSTTLPLSLLTNNIIISNINQSLPLFAGSKHTGHRRKRTKRPNNY